MEESQQTTPIIEAAAPVESEPAPEVHTGQQNPWKTVGIILAVLAVILIAIAVFYGLATHPYFTAVLRDVSIIVLALVTMITSIFLAILLFQLQSLIVLLRDEVQPILESMNETAGTVRGTTTFVSDSVVTPMITAASYVAGARTTVRTLFGGSSRRRQPSSRSPKDVTPKGSPPQQSKPPPSDGDGQ
jgi:hypothetical protein